METTYIIIMGCSVGVIVSLTAYIWSQQNKRIIKLEDQIKPLQELFSDIREIRTDMSWMKRKLFPNDK